MDLHGLNQKLIIVAVITLFFTLFFTTGAFQWVTGKVSGTCPNDCFDSDSGSIYVKGTISGHDSKTCAEFEKTDYCSSDNLNILKEYKCDVTRKMNWYSELISCEHGCKDGACIQ